MFKSAVLATVVLFWVTLSVSLVKAQLTASPVYKMRVPTYRSLPVRSISIAQLVGVKTTTAYN